MEDATYRRKFSNLKYIVVHHSVTGSDATIEEIRHMHLLRGYSDIGYHYIVTEKGMKAGRCILFRGAHAQSQKPPYLGNDMNRVGIGLCIIGDFSKSPPNPKLINEAAFAIKILARKFKIPLDRKHVIGHREVSFTACPGEWTMEKIYKKLEI